MNPQIESLVVEGRVSVEAMSLQLLELERVPADHALREALFAHMHALKGRCGQFTELRGLLQVVHAAEDALDALRDGTIRFGAEHADLLFSCLDLIAHRLDGIGAGEAPGALFQADAERLVTGLRELRARDLSDAGLRTRDLNELELLAPASSLESGDHVDFHFPESRGASAGSGSAPASGSARAVAGAPEIERLNSLAAALVTANGGLPGLAAQAAALAGGEALARELARHHLAIDCVAEALRIAIQRLQQSEQP